MKKLENLLNSCKKIDLTHPLHEKIPTWNGSCGFQYAIKMDYDRGLRVLNYKCHAGIGTHIDAPSHFIQGGKDVNEIPIETLIVPCYVLDLSAKRSPGLQLKASDIDLFEKKQGKIEKGGLFFLYTGWSAFWGEPERYRNVGPDGKMSFPTYSKEAVELLLEREIVGIGIDTFSPDPPESTFPVHHLMLGNGKYILENVAHLEEMPASGAYAINLPLNICSGTESPVRLIGLVPFN